METVARTFVVIAQTCINILSRVTTCQTADRTTLWTEKTHQNALSHRLQNPANFRKILYMLSWMCLPQS